jgi:hypothetical protein
MPDFTGRIRNWLTWSWMEYLPGSGFHSVGQPIAGF